MCRKIASVIFCLFPAILVAQQKTDLQQVLDRLDRIEQENKDLAEQVRSLRAELAASRALPPPSTSAAEAAPVAPLEERVAVTESRIAEQAQSKVEASQKLPITLTGMVLFNAFLNGRANNGAEYPTLAALGANSSAGGATLSQSVVGMKFQGPEIFGGGHISGSAFLDAWGGTPSNSLNHYIRLRTATVEIDWKNTTILAGQDKPIVSPREPNSLAQVAVSPLTGAGNLWLWSPQVRVDQRFAFGQQAGLTAQLGVYETSEPSYASRGGDSIIASSPRPALEGRFEFWRKFGEGARLEIAPGFHDSTTHAGGFSAPSHLFTLDWLVQPASKVQFTGMFFTGQNAAGLGGLRQGFTIFNDIRAVPVGATGGWGQLSYLATKRLTFNIFGGQESDNVADLLSGDIRNNFMYAGNAIYRLGSNVLLGAEVSQVRTNYFLLPSRLNNHYDLSLAYLFRPIAILLVALPSFASSVTGRVELRDSREASVRKRLDYSGVVISLAPIGKPFSHVSDVHVKMLQKDKMFTPHILAVVAGTYVDFPNDDPIFHNAFSSYSGEIFDVGLYAPGTSRSVQFFRVGVVRVFCNIHSAMSAVIVVLPTPYFATTRKDGTFQIPNVPPGEYQMTVFHERATEATLRPLSHHVVVEPAPLALPPIVISEAGFLQMPHNNKYGRGYAPETDEHSIYPAAKKE